MGPDMCVPCGDGFLNIRVGAIIQRNGRFLMVRNSQSDYYYSVGGRIRFGETAEQAVVREVFEETGVTMEIDHLGFVQENYFIADNLIRLGKEYYELSFYFYMKTPEDFEPVAKSFTEDDHPEYLEWVAPDEPRTVFPAFFRTELEITDKTVRHIVTDERFYLRKMTPSDLGALCALLSDPEVMRCLEPPFTHEQTETFLREQGLAESPRILAAEDKDHAFIGYAIYHDYDETDKEIGWVLKKDVWGKGYASQITKVLTAMALSEGKGAVIECVPEQTATKRIAARNGFVFSGNRDGLDIYRRGIEQ